eukprot:c17737_g1_i1.p1 GENE.c17737_g1_i1~~c17737_g1_i1.p1  ORF type:complete len:849 (-),score=157.01 c17737_g1_i1:120-2666(-)
MTGCAILDNDVFMHHSSYVGPFDPAIWCKNLRSGEELEYVAISRVEGRNRWRTTHVRDLPGMARRLSNTSPPRRNSRTSSGEFERNPSSSNQRFDNSPRSRGMSPSMVPRQNPPPQGYYNPSNNPSDFSNQFQNNQFNQFSAQPPQQPSQPRPFGVSRHLSLSPVAQRRNNPFPNQFENWRQYSQPTSGAPVAPRWKLPTDDPLANQINAILNKLTPEMFGKLTDQLCAIPFTDAQALHTLVNSIFDKAMLQSVFSELYAELCVTLANRLPEVPEGPAHPALKFSTVVAERCKYELDTRTSVDNAAADKKGENKSEEGEEGEEGKVELDEADKEAKIRVQKIGILKFFGEMYKHSLIPRSAMMGSFASLLSSIDSGDKKLAGHGENTLNEEAVIAVCRLMQTVGKRLEGESPKEVGQYMERLASLKTAVGARVRFMIMDVEDLRNNKWVPRREEVKAKKLSELKQEDEEASRIQRNERRHSSTERLPSSHSSSLFSNASPIAPVRRHNSSNSQTSRHPPQQHPYHGQQPPANITQQLKQPPRRVTLDQPYLGRTPPPHPSIPPATTPILSPSSNAMTPNTPVSIPLGVRSLPRVASNNSAVATSPAASSNISLSKALPKFPRSPPHSGLSPQKQGAQFSSGIPTSPSSSLMMVDRSRTDESTDSFGVEAGDIVTMISAPDDNQQLSPGGFPAPPPSPPQQSESPQDFDELCNGYFDTEDIHPVCAELERLNCDRDEFVRTCVHKSFDRAAPHRLLVSQLFAQLAERGTMTPLDFESGFKTAFGCLEDLVLDVPEAYKYADKMLRQCCSEGCFDSSNVRIILQNLEDAQKLITSSGHDTIEAYVASFAN